MAENSNGTSAPHTTSTLYTRTSHHFLHDNIQELGALVIVTLQAIKELIFSHHCHPHQTPVMTPTQDTESYSQYPNQCTETSKPQFDKSNLTSL